VTKRNYHVMIVQDDDRDADLTRGGNGYWRCFGEFDLEHDLSKFIDAAIDGAKSVSRYIEYAENGPSMSRDETLIAACKGFAKIAAEHLEDARAADNPDDLATALDAAERTLIKTRDTYERVNE